MTLTLLQGSYILAGLLFILALGGLSKHETAKKGNFYGIAGMAAALVITVLGAVIGIDAAADASDRPGAGPVALALMLGAMAVGAVIGVIRGSCWPGIAPSPSR